jgi:hypothetical protein
MGFRLAFYLSNLAPEAQTHPLEKVVCPNPRRSRGAVFDFVSWRTH